MSVSSFFQGKVRTQVLPRLSPPTDATAPLLKRLMLPQGELAQIHDGEQGIHYLAFLELRAGTIRGNHYHERKEEFFYLIAGEVLLALEDLATGERESISLRAGDLVHLQVRVAHAFSVVQPGSALEFSPERFDPTDTFRHNLA